MTGHNAVTDPVRGGFQAHCLECPWKGPVRRPSRVVLARIANARAEDDADEDAEQHSEDTK